LDAGRSDAREIKAPSAFSAQSHAIEIHCGLVGARASELKNFSAARTSTALNTCTETPVKKVSPSMLNAWILIEIQSIQESSRIILVTLGQSVTPHHHGIFRV